MYQLVYSTQFKKDFKKITKMPIADIIEVGNIISRLQREENLDTKHVIPSQITKLFLPSDSSIEWQ
ncbi:MULTISPECIES: hypothetical protein [Marinomonas]|uniref:Uncharacterized protein n=1 Tax=Marinomonas rhodophyticola TaxID=2992803 RepID=A0ABT3KC89_9GAMM|nr:hypothetical protein [Marinomonas sp. KJ51-3]MCW4628158.1 hypothetical protein [Marinomonas sp. KJ51-3]